MAKYETTLSAVRAMQIWPLLICAARDRKSYTYEELGKIIGVPRHGFRPLLEPIYEYCNDKKNPNKEEYPKLTILVVSEVTGMPSLEGMTEIDKDNVNELREEVFQYDWFAIKQPQISDFEKD